MRATQPAPTSWSNSESEMGPTSVRSRRPWRISSWPAANGMAGSSAVPVARVAPQGAKRATASAMDMTLPTSRYRTAGAWKRSIVTVEPARESSQRGALGAVAQLGTVGSGWATTEPPLGSTTSSELTAGSASVHQLLHVTTNHAEPPAGGEPYTGIATPGTSWTVPAFSGTARAWLLTWTGPPFWRSSATRGGVPV